MTIRHSKQALANLRGLHSFSLVELLVVMTIIGILAAIIIGAASGALREAAHNRAKSEIQAFATALESYKADNGSYPISDQVLLPANYASSDGTGTEYQTNSGILYLALTGQTNYAATVLGGKSYLALKRNQVGDTPTYSYIKDPWGYSYGYSTGTTNGSATPANPNNGQGNYDVWSTGGILVSKVNTNAWINNWNAQ